MIRITLLSQLPDLIKNHQKINNFPKKKIFFHFFPIFSFCPIQILLLLCCVCPVKNQEKKEKINIFIIITIKINCFLSKNPPKLSLFSRLHWRRCCCFFVFFEIRTHYCERALLKNLRILESERKKFFPFFFKFSKINNFFKTSENSKNNLPNPHQHSNNTPHYP